MAPGEPRLGAVRPRPCAPFVRSSRFRRMSNRNAETVATEVHDPAALERAGWTNAEVIWEQVQEAAAECERAGESVEAAELWQGAAVDLAREHLPDGDLRVATSVANLAVAERWAGDSEAAARRVRRGAIALWDAGGEWVESLAPVARARSSTFHLRLESKHPGAYDRFPRERYRRLAREGREVLVARRDGRPDRDGPARTVAAASVPPGFNDLAPPAWGRAPPRRGRPGGGGLVSPLAARLGLTARAYRLSMKVSREFGHRASRRDRVGGSFAAALRRSAGTMVHAAGRPEPSAEEPDLPGMSMKVSRESSRASHHAVW